MTYLTTATISSASTINFTGPEEVIEQIKASGVSLPMKVTSEQEIETTTECGTANTDGIYPFKITYEKVKTVQSIPGVESPVAPSPLTGMSLYGKLNAASKLTVDSVVGDQATEDIKMLLKDMLEKMMEQLVLPDTVLKVGESFEQRTPMTMPTGTGQQFDMVIITHRTLTKVDGDLAYFDVKQTVNLDMETEAGTMEAEGGGTGSEIHDLNHGFVTDYRGELVIGLTMPIQGMIMTAEVKSVTSNQTSIR